MWGIRGVLTGCRIIWKQRAFQLRGRIPLPEESVSGGNPVLGPKRTWTKTDWEEYLEPVVDKPQLTNSVVSVPRLTPVGRAHVPL